MCCLEKMVCLCLAISYIIDPVTFLFWIVRYTAGGARAWGTTGSRRNHLTHYRRWLTSVMSWQLLLHVVCIYFVHDRDRPVTSGKVQWRPWKSGDNRESLVTPWEKVPWWQGLWMWVSPPSLQLKSLWLRLWATKNALRVAVAGRENIPPKDLRMKTRPWMRLQRTAAVEETVPSSLNDASNQHANASSNAILFWKISRMMGPRTQITTTVFLSPLLPQRNLERFRARLGSNGPEETRVRLGHDSTKNSPLPSQCVSRDLLRNS